MILMVIYLDKREEERAGEGDIEGGTEKEIRGAEDCILWRLLLQQVFTFSIHYFRTNEATRCIGYLVMILLEYQ